MRIAIDPGHGGHDPGAVFGELLEKDICLAISRELVPLLVASDHQVLHTRGGDYFVTISQRARLANMWRADIFLSIHCNADPDEDRPGMREAKGAEVWIYPGSVKGRQIAESLEKAVRAFFPDRYFRGIKEEELGVLRLTHMPAALLEVAFIDTQESHRLADPQVQRAIAEAISSALNS